MGLSKNAARTLEQVKSGLSILYGADYFTEDEWIKLDGLIHKGNYVFTRGPQANILDEELMSFDDFEDTILPISTAPVQHQPVTAPKNELHPQVPTPISENPSLNFSESLPNDTSANTSAEASADEESAKKVVAPTIAEKAPEEAVIAAAPASNLAAPAPTPANGGLAWYTQAQLDEVKAFNANLTKAGAKGGAKKGRGGSKHTPSVTHSFAPPPQSNYDSEAEQDLNPQAPAWDAVQQPSTAQEPAWDAPLNAPQTSTGPQPSWGDILEKGFVPEKPAWETGTEIPETEIDDGIPSVAPDDTSSIVHTFPAPQWPEEEEKIENPSPTSAEQESRISSWADEVNAEGVATPVPVFDPVIQEPLNSRSTHGTDNFPQLIEQFTQVHGKKPRVVNDFHQPRNSTYKGPVRPDSRASVRTTSASIIPSKTRTLEATSGTILLAHSNSPKRSNVTMEVRAGDTIRYLKHVSGILHVGVNLRTKQQGQFPEAVLEPVHSQSTLIQQQRSAIQNIYGRDRGDTFASKLSQSLDRVESTNAAVWERESEASRPTTSSTQAVAPVPIRSSGGLAGSRFAALAEMESQDGESEKGGSMQAELRRIIREELAHSPATTQFQRSRTAAPPPEKMLTNIVPKVTTCWFWKTKNDCRFTAEECIHLHADLPDGGEPANLRSGKPTWGALADATISPPSTIISKSAISRTKAAIDYKRFSKSKTCYYWATDGKCNNTEEDCKYLHEYTEAGVAYKPGGNPSYKKDFNWSKVGRNGAVTEDLTSPPAQTLYTNEYGWGARNGKDDASEAAQTDTWDAPNESSAALMANPNAAIWGAVEGSSAWDLDGDVYKPPHIKALEERERIEAVGW